MIYGYARVSTKKQNEDRQIEALVNFGVEENRIKIDKASGKDFDRDNYLLLRNEILREGDTLVIKELDRLGRNKEQIKEELNYFKNNKIRVKILNIPTTLIDFPEGQEWVFDMVNNILIEVLGAIAEEERIKSRKRQREGIDVMPIDPKTGKKMSKKTGNVTGRPTFRKFPKDWEEKYNMYKEGSLKAKEIQNIYNWPKSTFYYMIKQYEEEHNINQ